VIVAGLFCPMGCGETLSIPDHKSSRLVCRNLDCVRPDAASVILSDSETEHVVKLEATRFTIRHPLRERLDDELMRCSLHSWLTSQDEPPCDPGRYRVTWRGQAHHAIWQPMKES
jgi:hypothetical protein